MRIGTFQNMRSRIDSVLEQQRKMSSLHIQASSGRRDTRLSDVGNNAGRVIDLASERTRVNAALETLRGVSRTLRSSDDALSNLQDLAQRGRAMLVQAMGVTNPKYDLYQISAQARAMLDDALNVLNRQSEGRFLFNDMAPDTPPAAFRDEWTVRFDDAVPASELSVTFDDGLAVTAPIARQGADVDIAATTENLRGALAAAGRLGAVVELRADAGTLYILGNVGDAMPGGITRIGADIDGAIATGVRNTRQRADIDVRTVDYATIDSTREALARKIDSGIAVTPTVRVDEPAIEKLIRALRQLENADLKGAEGERMTKQANALLIESIEDFGGLRAAVGLRANEVDHLGSSLEETLIATESTDSEIRDVDISELMTKIAAQQVQLEAAYMMLSKMGELSLVNHLR